MEAGMMHVTGLFAGLFIGAMFAVGVHSIANAVEELQVRQYRSMSPEKRAKLKAALRRLDA